MKKEMILVACSIILLIVYINALSIDFVNPTPSDNTQNSSFYVNISTDEIGDNYIFTDLDNSTVGWWMFDYYSANGLTVYDNSSRGNHATNVSLFNASKSTEIVAGYWGNAWNATNSTGYLKLTNIPTKEYTISFWVKADAAPAARTFIFDSTGVGGYPYISHETSGKLLIRYGADSNNYIYTNASIGTSWHHIVVKFSSKNLYGTDIYTDSVWGFSGANYASGTYNGTFSSTMYLGSTFAGLIDDVIIFNRSLSLAEVKSLYNASYNKYFVNFSFSNGLITNKTINYISYITNSSGQINNSIIKTFVVQKGIGDYIPYNNQYVYPVLNLSVITNFPASCKYSLDSGITNYTMSSTDNINFNATNSSISQGDYTVIFYCNDSDFYTNASANFTFNNHFTFFVDKNNIYCSDSYASNGVNYTSDKRPFCSINKAVGFFPVVSLGSEMIVKYGDYCEGINFGATALGTASNPSVIRGESDSLRPILNGTCAPIASFPNGIAVQGGDFVTFKYFYITNFSSDGMNVHANGADNSLNITFENITTYQTGYLGRGVVGGAEGDGISFHDYCTGTGKWLNLSGNWKSGIVDINGAQTDYYDINIDNPEDYGIYFSTESGLNLEKHNLERITVTNSPNWCVSSVTNLTIDTLTCINNSNNQIRILDDYATINHFNISGTPLTYSSFYIDSADYVNLTNGAFDGNISVSNTPIVNVINVSYNLSKESVISSGNLTRYWYLDSSSNINNTNITITNSTGDVVYSNLINGSIPQQTFLSYNNIGGTRTWYSNYTITASADNYHSQNISVNLTNNNVTSFTLLESTAPTLTINSPIATTYTISSILFNATLNENGTCQFSVDSGITNYTMSSTNNLNFNYTKSLADGSYTSKFYCNDTSGNRNDTMNVSFSINTSTASANPSSSGGGLPVYTINSENLFNGYAKSLSENWKMSFKINNQSHELELEEINYKNKSAKISILSEKQEKELFVGGEWKINLDSDDYYDLYVKLNNLTSTRAEIYIKEIKEEIEKTELPIGETQKDGEEINGEKDKSYSSVFIAGIIILLSIAAIIYYLYRKTRKKNKYLVFKRR